MIKFDKPENLDGAKLIDELLAAGIKTLAKDPTSDNGYQPPLIDGLGDFYLAIQDSEKSNAETVVKAHKG